jgi:hypothetical protein
MSRDFGHRLENSAVKCAFADLGAYVVSNYPDAATICRRYSSKNSTLMKDLTAIQLIIQRRRPPLQVEALLKDAD